MRDINRAIGALALLAIPLLSGCGTLATLPDRNKEPGVGPQQEPGQTNDSSQNA